MRKSWENEVEDHWNTWENHRSYREIVGKIMGTFAKTIGRSWRHHGKLSDIHGNIWENHRKAIWEHIGQNSKQRWGSNHRATQSHEGL